MSFPKDGGGKMLCQETVSQFEMILVVSGDFSGEAVEQFDRKLSESCAGRRTKGLVGPCIVRSGN
jgi:hypothetical protein